MSSEAAQTTRIFKIRKQTFQKKIKGTDEWIVDIEARDENGDELHYWKLKSSYNNINHYWFVNLSGSAMDTNAMYDKCYCKVDVYINEKDKLTIRNGHMKGPMFNGFNFPDIYNLGYDPRSTSNQEILLFITIASCDENRFTEKQKSLLDDGTVADTIIKTKDQEFPCHKFVLASHSEYFMKMFQTDMKESQTNCVDWTDVFDAPVVEDLLHFLYTGQKPPNIDDNHFGLLEAAHLCLLPDLRGMCVDSIVPTIYAKNAAYVLQSAVIHESNALQRQAVKFVGANWSEVLTTDFYQQLEPDICKRLLKNIFEMFREKLAKDGK